MDHKKGQKFWDRRAEEYGKVSNEAITLFGTDEFAKKRDRMEKARIAECIDYKKHKRILDLGCGIGRFTLRMAEKARFVWGVDYSEPLLEVAKIEAAKLGLGNVGFACGSVTQLVCQEKYDLILANGLLSYMSDEDARKTIKVMSGHLEHGGTVLSKESVTAGKRFEVSQAVDSIYRTVRELEGMFMEKGFKIISSEKLYHFYHNIKTWFMVLEKI